MEEQLFIKILHAYIKYDLNYWDPNKFNWKYCDFLAQYCSKYFNIWWDPDKFNWKHGTKLYRYCLDYILIWFKDSIKNNPDDLTNYVLQNLDPEQLKKLQIQLLLNRY